MGILLRKNVSLSLRSNSNTVLRPRRIADAPWLRSWALFRGPVELHAYRFDNRWSGELRQLLLERQDRCQDGQGSSNQREREPHPLRNSPQGLTRGRHTDAQGGGGQPVPAERLCYRPRTR